MATAGVLERVNYVLDWSNPVAAATDGVLKHILTEYLNADNWFEDVTGDDELIIKTAEAWRTAARDLRGVVDDLVAERKAVERSWAGEAGAGFSKTMIKFEQAMLAEADDMDTIAELLELAAAACTMAEQLMQDLVIEIVEAILIAWPRPRFCRCSPPERLPLSVPWSQLRVLGTRP